MSEMQDRVAKVLFGWMHGHDNWDDADPYEREDCIEAASVVIEAMRKPTAGMLSAAGHASDGSGDVWAGDVWDTMITASLK